MPIEAHDQRTQICYGSLAEVRRFEEYVYGQSPRFAESEVSFPWCHTRGHILISIRTKEIIGMFSSCQAWQGLWLRTDLPVQVTA